MLRIRICSPFAMIILPADPEFLSDESSLKAETGSLSNDILGGQARPPPYAPRPPADHGNNYSVTAISAVGVEGRSPTHEEMPDDQEEQRVPDQAASSNATRRKRMRRVHLKVAGFVVVVCLVLASLVPLTRGGWRKGPLMVSRVFRIMTHSLLMLDS